MWNFLAGLTIGAVIATGLLAWFLHAVEHSKHSEDERPATIPATIQVRTYPYTYTTNVDPTTLRSLYHYALNDTGSDKLSDIDLARLAHMRLSMDNGLYSEE
jgi:hypothetical protein